MIAVETDNIPVTLGLVSFVGGIVTASVLTLLWFTNELRKNRALFFKIISKHNREDDANFQQLSDAVWTVIARNAHKDGDVLPPRRSPVKRRYLIDDDSDEDSG